MIQPRGVGQVHVTVTDKDQYELAPDNKLVCPANEFLRSLRLRGLSPHTVRAYAYDIAVFLRWFSATERQLEQLLMTDLVDFIGSQRQMGSDPRSINRRLSTVRLLYRFCTGQDLAPVRGVSLSSPHYRGPGRDHHLGLHRLRQRGPLRLRVKEAHKLVEPLTPQQVRSFFRSLRRYRDLAIVHLMLLCGLRSAEVLTLELTDVVFEDARVRVRGKGSRERMLPLPGILAELIRCYLHWERPRHGSCQQLFVVLQGRRRGRPMTAAGLRSIFRHRRRRAALKAANAHRFRHTFGADMARASVRLPVLQRLMGHADAKTTLQYIRLSMSDIAAEYHRAMQELQQRYGHPCQP
jgi:site-specific recombinase XerD